jgi:hypothetical protein
MNKSIDIFAQYLVNPADSFVIDQTLSEIDEIIKNIFFENSTKNQNIIELLKLDLGVQDDSHIHLYIKSFLSTLPQVNNVGDPFEKHFGPFAGDTKSFMLEILDFFAKLTKFKKNEVITDFKKGV